MKIALLNLLVTIAGLVFFTTSLAIILLGKRVGEKDSGQQKIKVGKYIEVDANSIITLVLITAFLSIAPLAFTYWKPELTAKEYTIVIVYGYVILDNGTPAADVEIVIIRTYKEESDTMKTKKTSEQGNFSIPIENAKPGEKYEIVCMKPGYNKKTLNFGFNDMPFAVTLRLDEGN